MTPKKSICTGLNAQAAFHFVKYGRIFSKTFGIDLPPHGGNGRE